MRSLTPGRCKTKRGRAVKHDWMCGRAKKPIVLKVSTFIYKLVGTHMQVVL